MSLLNDLIDRDDRDGLKKTLEGFSADELEKHINATDNRDQATPLIKAAEKGWAEAVELLIRAGADVKIKDFYERDALTHAVTKGDIASASVLLAAGASPDTRKFKDSPTALHIAIERKDFAMVELLVASGGSIAAQTPPAEKGLNAFHYAAKSTPEIMDLLLKQPGAPDLFDAIAHADNKNISAFRIALETGNRDMAEKLIAFGADINALDDSGETPLFYLLAHRPGREEALPLIRLLLQNGADVDKAKNYWDESPLFPAVRESFTEAVGMLLELGVDPKQRNHFQQTPLHLAAEKWDEKVVKLLVAHGADVNALDRQKRTPLHVAAHANRLKVVEALLDKGADPFLKDAKGKTPRDLAPAEFQRSVNRAIDRKEQELEIKRDGYTAYWNRKAKEKDPVPSTPQRGSRLQPRGHRFGGRR